MKRGQLLQLGATLSAAALSATTLAACTVERVQTRQVPSRRTRVAHLLRRAGFGASEEQLDAYQTLGLVRAVDRLVDYERVGDDAESRLNMISLDLKKLADMQRWWLLRMAYTQRPLQEKMTLFWHGLLTSATAKVGLPNPTAQNPDPPHYMWAQHRFLREHALDRYEDLLLGISRDPAMMIWLDAQTNVKGKPNENYARELMELFVLGEGNYTEQDVREAARAFTGWGLDQGRLIYRANNHDPAVKTVLGKRVQDGSDVVKLLADQTAAAHFLSRRLWEFFVYPRPSSQDLAPLVAVYQRSRGNVREMLRTLFNLEAFYSERAYRALVKSPVELVVGAIRSLGVATDASSLPGSTTRMGQALFNPPNVAGWPGGTAWLNTSAWLERINFANALVIARDDAHTLAPALAATLERLGLETIDAVVDYFCGLLLDGQVRLEARAVLMEYMQHGSSLGGPAPFPAQGSSQRRLPVGPARPAYIDQKVRGLVYLILASPDYQLN